MGASGWGPHRAGDARGGGARHRPARRRCPGNQPHRRRSPRRRPDRGVRHDARHPGAGVGARPEPAPPRTTSRCAPPGPFRRASGHAARRVASAIVEQGAGRPGPGPHWRVPQAWRVAEARRPRRREGSRSGPRHPRLRELPGTAGDQRTHHGPHTLEGRRRNARATRASCRSSSRATRSSTTWCASSSGRWSTSAAAACPPAPSPARSRPGTAAPPGRPRPPKASVLERVDLALPEESGQRWPP